MCARCVLKENVVCASTATGCECQETTLRSDGKMPRMKRSMKEVLSNRSTARCSAIPSQICVVSVPRRRLRSINPSKGNSCFVAVRSCGTSLRFMRWVQLGGVIDERRRLTLAPVSRIHSAVRMAETESLYVIRSLYVDFATNTISVCSVESSSGSDKDTVPSVVRTMRGCGTAGK